MKDRTSQRKILIVDDDESVRRTLERIIKKIQPECALVSSAEEARRSLEADKFDLILCDINMPGESGMDLISHVRSAYPETAVIMVSGMDDPEMAEKALEIGAYGYMIKPFKPSEIIINVSSALRRQKLETKKQIYMEKLEQKVESRTIKIQETLESVIEVISLTVESRDPYTAGHQLRVAELAYVIAEEMGWPLGQVKGVRMAGMIHDLGKISVPAEILSKPTRLTDIEFELIKTHPRVGYEILKGIDFPWPIAQVVYQHHERIDGSGYPKGLKGEEIIKEARIMAVADVVEAMGSHRPYRAALGGEEALEEISKNRGITYDQEVVDICLEIFRKGKFNFYKENKN
ncbi:HD domain-containing phosphohydrolase [Thermodesulfobacteriota bacterium]